VLSEMQVEGIVMADEALAGAKAGARLVSAVAGHRAADGVARRVQAPHAQARAVVRTGECTPYANIILIAGVSF
jgi:D-ribose pyranase